jgi:hypothetical protein
MTGRGNWTRGTGCLAATTRPAPAGCSSAEGQVAIHAMCSWNTRTVPVR